MSTFKLWDCVGPALRKLYDGTIKEPLPERWVDLIKRLNPKEKEEGR